MRWTQQVCAEYVPHSGINDQAARELKISLLGKEYHTTIEHERRVHVFFMLAHVWHDRWEVWEAFGGWGT